MSVSADVSAGDDILASQYNDLREDATNDITSHDHTASGNNGQQIGLAGLLAEVTDRLMNFRTAAPIVGGVTAGLITVLNLTTTKGILNGVMFIRGSVDVNPRTRITVDGVIIIDDIGPTMVADIPSAYLSNAGSIESNEEAAPSDPKPLGAIQIWFTDSLLVEVQNVGAGSSHRVQYATHI